MNTGEKKFVQLQIAGSLLIPGLSGVYDLLSPRPIRNIEEISEGGPKKFYVCTGNRSKARFILVNGPYVVDYFSAGKMLEVELMQEEKEEELEEFQQIFSTFEFYNQP